MMTFVVNAKVRCNTCAGFTTNMSQSFAGPICNSLSEHMLYPPSNGFSLRSIINRIKGMPAIKVTGTMSTCRHASEHNQKISYRQLAVALEKEANKCGLCLSCVRSGDLGKIRTCRDYQRKCSDM